MKKYIIPFLVIVLLLPGCFKEEDELMQSYKKAGQVFVSISITNAIIPTTDLQNSYAGFTIDEVKGKFDKLSIRTYFKKNNSSAILDEFTSIPTDELQYTIAEMAEAVGYSVDDIKAKDQFSIEVLTTVNGVTSASRDASFNASIIYVDRFAGIYDVEAVSFFSPGDWDEYWPAVLISPNEQDTTTYLISGIAGSAAEIVASFNLDSGTVTIIPNQVIGDIYDIGTIAVVYQDGSVIEPIVGELYADSSMVIGNWGHLLTDGDYAGELWDIFTTNWTKR